MTNNLPDLYSMIAIIIIAIFIPIITLVSRKYIEDDKKNKILKIMSISIFLLEAIRFFYNAHFFEGAKVPATELRFGFITFMTILSLFATFLTNEKITSLLKRSFILLSFVPFFIGLLGDRCYMSGSFEDKYALLKGLFFIEVGLIIAIALIYYLDENFKLTFKETLFAFVFCLISVGVALFYNLIWKLNINYNTLWFIQKCVYSISPFFVYIATALNKRKN